ncbi:MAG TPA: hypothetical protein VL426_05235 [Candidatus Binatia bacterium]|jgi:hypothetical protein|nr:hypothetical protein [Candidatus Binatia bacterium]
MTRSNAVLAIRYLAVDVVGSLLYFPLWWFSAGAYRTGRFCVGTVRRQAQAFAIGVWLRNLFTPMYGLRDWQGRIISFFMRLMIVTWYSIVLTVMSVLMLLLFIAWLAFPLFVAAEFARQLAGVMTSFRP